MGFSLKIISGPEEGSEFSFERVQITIGRTIDNDVVLPDPGISRQHFSIRDKGGAFIIKDLGSSNGTLLNGKKIEEEVIKTGDVITAGGARIRFDGPTGSKSARSEEKRSKARPGRSASARAKGRNARPSVRRAQAARRKARPTRNSRSPARAGRGKSSGNGLSIKSAGMRKGKKQSEAKPAQGSASGHDIGKAGLFSKVKLWILSLDKKKKIMVFSGMGVLLLLVVFALFSGGTKIVQSLRWYDDVDLKAGEWAGDEPMSYGLKLAKRNCLYRAMFKFKYASGRATMTFMVSGIDSKNEVEILLNGVHVEFAPLTLDQWSNPITINLPRRHLLENQINKVEFINTINRDDPNAKEEWAVAVGDITEQPLPPANKRKALEAFSNAVERYKNKGVSPGNLYRALQFYEKARDFLELMDEKSRPDEYQESVEMIDKINKELDKVYHKTIFEAEKLFKYGKRKEAKEVYRLLMIRFPDQHDPRNKTAREAYIRLGGSLQEVN